MSTRRKQLLVLAQPLGVPAMRLRLFVSLCREPACAKRMSDERDGGTNLLKATFPILATLCYAVLCVACEPRACPDISKRVGEAAERCVDAGLPSDTTNYG